MQKQCKWHSCRYSMKLSKTIIQKSLNVTTSYCTKLSNQLIEQMNTLDDYHSEWKIINYKFVVNFLDIYLHVFIINTIFKPNKFAVAKPY